MTDNQPNEVTPLVLTGQKALIWAVILNLLLPATTATIGAENATPILFGSISVMDVLVTIIGLCATYLSIFGTISVAKGLGYTLKRQSLLCVLMLIPVVNVIALLVLNSKATKLLRQAGYKVGLLGARSTPLATAA